jgi:methylated-DNA-protein-cysteine methyltransferase-like protein
VIPDEEAEPSAYAARVLAVVAQIPPGAVMSYGDVAEFMGEGSARGVGRVLFRWGSDVPWQRVVMSNGAPKPHGRDEHLARLRDEGVPLTADGSRVDMRLARWDGR